MVSYETFSVDRRDVRNWSWPVGARIVMSVELAFEAFERHNPYRAQAVALSQARPRAAELHPEVVAAVVEAGHEIAGHGWVNDRLFFEVNREQERDLIRKCTDVIATAAGTRPAGWTSPALMCSEHTFELLADEGYLWCGDDASADLPFVNETRSGLFVSTPRSSAFQNDLSVRITHRGPDVVWQGFKDAFDLLYEESALGLPNKTELTLHCHLAGRTTLTPTVRRCLSYAKGQQDVWFATRREIAAWSLDRHDRN